MSTSTDAYLAYGIDIGAASEDIDLYNLPTDLDKGVVGCVIHCCDAEPMGIITITSTVQCAWRGEPKTIDTNMFSQNEPATMDKLLKEFCDEHKLEYKKPGWLLFSWWG